MFFKFDFNVSSFSNPDCSNKGDILQIDFNVSSFGGGEEENAGLVL